jgi:alkanesulfonate monooxygenase
MSMTSGFGCPLRAQQGRSAIRHVWWAPPSAEAILKYYRLGAASFLIRGFDPLNDAVEFGRELIPRIKAGAIEIDREYALPAASTKQTLSSR